MTSYASFVNKRGASVQVDSLNSGSVKEASGGPEALAQVVNAALDKIKEMGLPVKEAKQLVNQLYTSAGAGQGTGWIRREDYEQALSNQLMPGREQAKNDLG